MMETITKPLQILNASAGSGKTYNLVLTYLRMILGEGKNSNTFSKIMAMTFTNKAAFEMKHRIISALDLLSNPTRTSEKESEKARQYAIDVAKALNCLPQDLQIRAKIALKQILHQYEDFHVMTIDKFNLRLIRSFSMDLDLDADFQVILNEDEILEKVIDQMMDELDPNERKELTNLVIRYSKEKVEEQEGWNFQRDLKSFATVLTNEKYIEMLKGIKDMDYTSGGYSFVREKIKSLKETIIERAKSLFLISENYSAEELPGKSTTKKAYLKLIDTDKLFDGPSDGGQGFFSKSMINNLESGKVPVDLAQASLEFEHFFLEKIAELRFTEMVRKSFFNMALLKFISEKLDGIRQNEQLIRISEFNKMISELIEDEEAPFIYEKLGNRFQHFLLDEFQDTSRLQWMNIVPLVHESLSQNNANLIVGDPKQSIYRFKNGLAEQFVALPAIYNPEGDAEVARKSNYFEAQGQKIPLKDNWRSNKNIVTFNNTFFKTFAENTTPELAIFYQDAEQHPKGSDGGFIRVTSKTGLQKEDVRLATDYMLLCVEECIANGIDKGDICILGNKKKDCNEWAITLTNLGHKVVSSDSLLVNSDKGVKLTIAYLKWRKNPTGDLEARRFSEMYFSLKGENSIVQVQSYWKTIETEESTFTIFDKTRFLIEQFGSEDQFFFPFENLYSLLQGFYLLADLKEIHNPYLHHLSDMAHDYDNQRGPDLDLFIDNYEKKGKDASIQIPENKNAIKIMTGHKSKGLEFPVVIIPNMNWDIRMSTSKHLIKEDNQFIHTRLSGGSKLNFLKSEFEFENNQSTLDKMNLCYVMFTRPVERLYIGNFIEARKDDNKFGPAINAILHQLPLEQLGASILHNEDNELTFFIGKAEDKSNQDNTVIEEDLDFLPVAIGDRLWFPDISIQDNALKEDDGLSDSQRYGNQLHLLLSMITDSSQITTQVKSLLESGLIENAFEARLKADLTKILEMPEYINLLKDADKILNEQGIIINAGETKRPDKIILKKAETIVIDYKTGMPNPKHLKQVQVYADTLRAMGYPNVRGIVFYTGDLRLVRAESV